MHPEMEGRGATIINGIPFVWGRRTYVMGVINVTPDSFSGDAFGDDVDAAVRQALQFQEWGADIVDVGGESTRPASTYPGADSTSLEEELSRVIPAIEAMAPRLRVPISVDTYKSRVAADALAAGASMINDVWGMSRDPDMSRVVAGADVPVVLVHNQAHTRYDDLLADIIAALRRMLDGAVRDGVAVDKIILDPGIGFGKTVRHNLEVLRRLDELQVLDRPIMVGTSRKFNIGSVLDLPVDDRVEGTAATVALSIAKGADIVRVHDVREMARVVRMSDAIVRGWRPDGC